MTINKKLYVLIFVALSIIIISLLAIQIMRKNESDMNIPRQNQVFFLESDEDLDSKIGVICAIEGIPYPQGKGFLIVKSKNDVSWKVTFKSIRRWPQEVLGKKIKVQGTLRVFKENVDSRGFPINDHGHFIQGYGGFEKLYILSNSDYQVVGEEKGEKKSEGEEN